MWHSLLHHLQFLVGIHWLLIVWQSSLNILTNHLDVGGHQAATAATTTTSTTSTRRAAHAAGACSRTLSAGVARRRGSTATAAAAIAAAGVLVGQRGQHCSGGSRGCLGNGRCSHRAGAAAVVVHIHTDAGRAATGHADSTTYAALAYASAHASYVATRNACRHIADRAAAAHAVIWRERKGFSLNANTKNSAKNRAFQLNKKFESKIIFISESCIVKAVARLK